MAKYVKKINSIGVVVTGIGGGITSLNGLTVAVQTFTDDTNITIVSSGSAHVVTWSGTLADGRIASASVWNGKQNGSANLTSLSALTYASGAFVKMTGANTFTLDTNTYLTSLAGAWLTGGNTGAGNVIGTTDNNTWDAIANNLPVARFTGVASATHLLTITNSVGNGVLLNTAGDLNLNGNRVAVQSPGSSTDASIYFKSSTGVTRAFIRDNYSGLNESATTFALGTGLSKISMRSADMTITTGELRLPSAMGNITGASHTFYWINGSANSNTSGTRSLFALGTTGSGDITSASGSAIWNFLNFSVTVNQTGTSSGEINLINFKNITLTSVVSPLSLISSSLTANALYKFINHTGTAVSSFGGDINLTGTAKIATYAGNPTIGNGVASILGTFSVIGRTVVYTSQSIMTIPTTGVYEVVVGINCATPADFTNLTLNYTSGGVGQTHDKLNLFIVGVRSTETYLISCDASTALTFTTAITGSPTHDILIYVKRIA